MPSRLIREGILTSERIDQLDAAAEVFYRRLMSKVDDHGLYDARPSVLRTSLYPLRVDRVREADCSRWIAACEKAGLIALYSHDGKPYLQMLDTRWTARSTPKFPLPSDSGCSELLATENSCKQEQTPVPVFGVVVEDVVEVDKKRSRAVPPDGVSESVWKDFLQIRKAKRAPMTDTALAGIQREAEKAGLSLQKALEVCCERGWQGFKADWVAGDKSVSASVTVPSRQGPDPALLKIEEDSKRAAPIPASIREKLLALRGNGVNA